MIRRLSLADEVASRLRQKILDGEFSVGEKLPTEPELMKLFGVGRSTIREAIRNLSNIKLVRVQQGLGTFVEKSEIPSESLSDRLLRAKGIELNEVRQLIELKIAQNAAINRSEADLAKMKGYLEDRRIMAMANIPDKCIQADISFHLSIAEAAKSDILLDLYKTIASHLQSYFREIYFDTEGFITTQDWHESLWESIHDCDPQKAWEWAAKITGQPVSHLKI
ncbi:HTH-type transcriptional repressor NanR [Dyadobacter sp. CECT 9275]|uniref:HTH-type transcriptional repressor NanR n=1 Tax=Dyadobacter helix TaxID=2822344 RepID=A0A916JG82_9BACT|nr:GntR family transcriptional regulator [Dyadobacter sp. CECT 9275]CAG5009815.1 HTH-type transcriptional repressor NanR [Dyadobacter sp. CECT 9275]